MRHIEGDSRYQATFLPTTLDDSVSDNHPIRVIDAFIYSLVCKALALAKQQRDLPAANPTS